MGEEQRGGRLGLSDGRHRLGVSSLLGRELGRARSWSGSETFTPGLRTPSLRANDSVMESTPRILKLLFGSAWSYRATCDYSNTGFGTCCYIDSVYVEYIGFGQCIVDNQGQQPSRGIKDMAIDKVENGLNRFFPSQNLWSLEHPGRYYAGIE